MDLLIHSVNKCVFVNVESCVFIEGLFEADEDSRLKGNYYQNKSFLLREHQLAGRKRFE